VSDLTEEQLLHLVDRAEGGTLLANEAVMLRAGIRSLAAARRSLGGLQAKQQRPATPPCGYCGCTDNPATCSCDHG
jgi:hypothetical protein